MPRLLAPLLTLLLCLGVIGCSTPSKSFYILTAEGTPPTSGGIGIGVGPVTTADYLGRTNLVMQEGSNSLTIVESHRWAGKLEDNIARVMASNLGRQLGTSDVRTYPWTGDDGLKYQITLDIRQLHGHSDGHAVLDAAWSVYALPGRTKVTSRTWTATEPLTADGYEPLVAAESRLLARLARQISSSLK